MTEQASTTQQDIAGGGGSADPEDKTETQGGTIEGGTGGEATEATEKDRTQSPAQDANAAQVPHVQDAAPEDLDTDPASSVHTEGDGDNDAVDIQRPATMQEQKAPKLEGKAEQRGYYGETAADRAKAAKAELDPSLTVQSNAEAVAAVPSDTEEN